MSDSARQDRGPDVRLLKFVAPILLSSLACTQLVLGLFFGLTPWKGGGFGMFSTVDSNGARSLRVYLETDEGELPTQAPRWLGKRRNHASSFPTEFRMRGIVEELAASTWVPKKRRSSKGADGEPSGSDSELSVTDGDPDQEGDPDQNGEPVQPSADQPGEEANLDEPGEPAPETAVAAAESGRDKADYGPYPRVSALRAGEDPEDRVPLPVNAVRVEVWRVRFDADTNELGQELMRAATAKVARK